MPEASENFLPWLGILLCVTQSAMFSGLNLAMFSLNRLRLEVEVASGNEDAARVLAMRTDSNFLLTTILWGNVGVNVLLTLISDSMLAGVSAFLFSTFVITFFGEIMPQAYFSRHALTVAARLVPLLRLYQILLFPLAKPCALMLDAWIGQEGIQYFPERNLRELIRKHIDSTEAADIDRLEGLGALNFLSLDDLPIVAGGGPIDPASILELPWEPEGPVFPEFSPTRDDPFLKRVAASGRKWVILIDEADEPRLVLDSDEFLRHVLLGEVDVDPIRHCHAPIVARSPSTPLGWALSRLRFAARRESSKVIDREVILVWGETKRVITGADILGRLMEGIAERPVAPAR